MGISVQFRRDTAANWTSNDPTLLAGELGYESDTKKVKIGDGSTAWTSLAYVTLGAVDTSGTPVDNDFAKFTDADTIEGRSYAETLDDLSGEATSAFDMNGQDITNGGVIFLTEQADAEADVAGKGQIWVNTATPNELYFTDDAGTDVQLGVAGGAHAILDGSTHNDSVADAVTRGSIIYGNATPKWDELPVGTNGQVLTTDGTDISWGAGGAATAYDDIGDPDASGSIAMGAHTGTYTSATDGWGGIIIDNTTADLTSDTTLLTLQFKDNNDANMFFLKCIDDSAGTPDTHFSIGTTGNIITSGSVAVGSETTDSITMNGTGKALQFAVWGDDVANEWVSALLRASDTHSPTMIIGRSRGDQATPTAVADNDIIGQIGFMAHDGTDYGFGGYIRVLVDGTPGDDDLPTEMILATTQDGATTPTAALTIGPTQTATFASTVTATDLIIDDAGNIGSASDTDAIAIEADGDVVFSQDIYLHDAGGESLSSDGTDLTIASGAKIELTATSDVVIPVNIGLHLGDGAEKIESDNTDLTINSGGAINLTATSDVVVPANIGVTFGTGEKIEGDDTDLTLTSGGDIALTATADVNIPVNVGLRFGDGGENIETDNTDFTITSGGELNLTAASDVVIPVNIGLHLGDGAEKLESDNANLTINSGGELRLTATSDVVIPVNIGLHLGDGTSKLESDDTDLTINAGGDIALTATSDINVPANVGVTFGDDGEKIEGDGTDMTIACSGILNISATNHVLLAEDTCIQLDTVLSGDAHFSGIVEVGTAGATLAIGDIVYLQTADTRWELAGSDDGATGHNFKLGMCVKTAASDGDATLILLYGKIRSATLPALTVGAPVYLGTTLGDVQTSAPSGSTDIVRIVGYGNTAEDLFFCPENDWITLA